MNIWITYLIIAVILVIAELCYFKIADKCNIIDKPNERSSHSNVVLRGGGIIYVLGVWLYAAFFGLELWPFLVGITLVAGISFVDDIHSLPDSVRLVVQFIATALMMWSIVQGVSDGQGMQWFMGLDWYWQVLIGIVALIVFVGATDVINFMDGINGITAGYSIAVLVPLVLVNGSGLMVHGSGESRICELENGAVIGSTAGFIEPSYLEVAILGVLVFSFFNFRPKGKAKCFAGDVGSIGIAFIMLFAIGSLIAKTGDVTWFVLLLVYGVDGVCTIIHRIMLHEHIGEAHRKHAYQLMCNELKTGHVKISLLYMCLQLAVSLGFIYLCPNTVLAHWVYLVSAAAVLVVAYVVFMRKYYHLHAEWLASQKH